MENPKTKDFIKITEEEKQNFIASATRFPEELREANKLLYLYENLGSNINKFPRELTPILQMYWTCLRGLLVSGQLTFQAHIPEAYSIISRSAEATASARKMYLNQDKIQDWIKTEKNSSQPFRRILGKLFPAGDNVVYPEMFNIYELTSDFGRHPNFKSTIFFSDLGQIQTGNKVNFTYCDIEDELNLKRCINYLIYAYWKFLSVFVVIFEKFLNVKWLKEYKENQKTWNDFRDSLKIIFQKA
jgi:hypothetical protein